VRPAYRQRIATPQGGAGSDERPIGPQRGAKPEGEKRRSVPKISPFMNRASSFRPLANTINPATSTAC